MRVTIIIISYGDFKTVWDRKFSYFYIAQNLPPTSPPPSPLCQTPKIAVLCILLMSPNVTTHLNTRFILPLS